MNAVRKFTVKIAVMQKRIKMAKNVAENKYPLPHGAVCYSSIYLLWIACCKLVVDLICLLHDPCMGLIPLGLIGYPFEGGAYVVRSPIVID